MILLQPTFQIGAGPVPHAFAQRRADRAGVAVVAVGRDRSGVMPVAALAERKNAWAAAMSRCSFSMVSTRLPLRSMARYRYAQRPRTFRYVSSTCQWRPRLPCLP